MNDQDIVTRLRAEMSNEFVIEHPNMVRVPTLHEQAADEIERLRADLKRWQALCDTYYHKLALEPDNTLYFIFGYRQLAAGG